jgi:outer membrane lipoprotein-sorting protein
MKKYLLLGLTFVFCLFISGCSKDTEKDIVNELSKKIEKLDGYYLEGELEIINNDDSYLYDVEVAYYKDNNFKVSLKNKVNNHEQIILRNSEGVYVLTPSLNKSFKFQSEWPYNNSQSYLLQTLLKDIENDENKIFEKTADGYKFETSVNYSSNNDMKKQVILLDKDLNFTEVSIYNDQDELKMKMKFNNIDYKATFDDTYFNLNNNSNTSKEQSTNATLDSIIYPMYMPKNTQLSGQEKVSTETGERVILTFSGENPFMIVQETVSTSEDILTIPMYGEPYMVTGSVGALSSSSVTWVSDGVEFYVVSDVISQDELLNIASSMAVSALK